MDCGIVVSEWFELPLHYYVHFRTNTLGNVAQLAGAVEYTNCTSAEE